MHWFKLSYKIELFILLETYSFSSGLLRVKSVAVLQSQRCDQNKRELFELTETWISNLRLGLRCDVCAEGYSGDPEGRFGPRRPCTKCVCNENIDPNAVANCNRFEKFFLSILSFHFVMEFELSCSRCCMSLIAINSLSMGWLIKGYSILPILF